MHWGCNRQDAGAILMDAPMFGTIEDLIETVEDRREWNALANSMCPVDCGEETKEIPQRQHWHNYIVICIAVASGYVTKMQEEFFFEG